MPNYEVHLGVGSVIGIVVGLGVFRLFEPVLPFDYAFMAGMMAFEATMVGSILPDIDLHNSKPRRLLNAGLILGSGAAVYGLTYIRLMPKLPDPDIAHIVGFMFGLIAMIFAGRVVPHLVQALSPNHRGVLHNPGPYAVAFLVPAYGLWNQFYTLPVIPEAAEILFIAPGMAAIFIGTMVHLFLDYPTWRTEQHLYR